MRQQQLSNVPRRRSDGGLSVDLLPRSGRMVSVGGFGISHRSSRVPRHIRPVLTVLLVIATALVVFDAHLLAVLIAPSWWAPVLVCSSWWIAYAVAKDLTT